MPQQVCILLILIGTQGAKADTEPKTPWNDVRIQSTKDGEMQPALFYVPPGAGSQENGQPVPLLVVLHTWSSTYNKGRFGGSDLMQHGIRRGWVVIAPHFRGPNRRPQACASELAAQDVLDAVAYARQHANVDPHRIYLHGVSGGGHMCMVMAAKAPRLWAGVSAWVGISDLFAWHRECKARGLHYAREIERCCGGPPGKSQQIDAQYRQRSPIFHLAAAQGVPLDINAGINDGHQGSVPISHSLRAFNLLAEANGQGEKKLTEAQIRTMTQDRKIPQELAQEKLQDKTRQKKVLFQRTAGAARITIFDGGHEGDPRAAVHWLATQKRASLPTK